MRFYAILSMALALAGCSTSSADLRGIELAIESGSALAAAGALTLDAVAGTDTSIAACASATACAAYPCVSHVAITLGDACPLPYGDGARGTVQVTANLTSADHAQLSSTFVDAIAGGRALAVVSATSVTVDRSGAALSVRYTGQDVNTGAATLAAQSSWTITVDGGVYTIDGTDQQTGTSIDQLNVRGARLEPSCRRNPVAGEATLQHVSLLSIKQASIAFHAACDGNVDVGGDTLPLAHD